MARTSPIDGGRLTLINVVLSTILLYAFSLNKIMIWLKK